MKRDRNFRDELLRAVELAVTASDPSVALRELAAYEGARVYFARDHSPQKKSELYGFAIRTGTGMLDAAERLGDSRATAYRITSMAWKVIRR